MSYFCLLVFHVIFFAFFLMVHVVKFKLLSMCYFKRTIPMTNSVLFGTFSQH